jgi:hypothetical protein
MKESIWEQVLIYLYIKKRKPGTPQNIDLSLMNGMNRISLFIFFIAIIVMIVRAIRG